MAKLTKRAIDAFRYRGGWDVRWDEAVPGLGVRVYPSGKKAFVLSYRTKARKHLAVIGRFGADLTLDQARAKAGKMLSQIRDGIDPLEQKRLAGRGKTFGDLIDDFIVRHVQAGKFKTEGAIRRRLKRNIPKAWNPRLAEAVTPYDIETLHARIGQRAPYEANRLAEILTAMFSRAPAWGYVPKDADNPAAGIKRFPEIKRDRWATENEVGALAQAIDQEQSIYVRSAMVLYLLTGLRKAELLAAKWRDISWETGTLRLPVTKSGQPQTVALSAAAQAILRTIPALEGNPHVFPGGRGEQAHLVNIDKAWQRVRRAATVRLWATSEDDSVSSLVARLVETLERMPTYEECKAAKFDLPLGVDDLHLHDLRRTVGSWMTQAGVDLNVVKSAMRHSSLATTMIYARLGAEPARAALEQHGQKVMGIIGGPRPLEGGGAKK